MTVTDELIDTIRNGDSDPTNRPKSYKNRQIRSPLRERIQRFISVLGRYLKHQIRFLGIVGGLVLMMSSSEFDPQKTIADYDDESQSLSKALIYARVSSHEQTGDNEDDDTEDESEDGDDEEGDDSGHEGSIEGQIDELKELADDQDLELAHDPITDEAKSGTDFERDGIQKVFRLAQRDEIEYLLVEKVDRIGRSAAETLYFIYILQSECDVTLITPSGERDVGELEGLLHTTLMSLVAEIENEIRTSKATKERVRNFVEKKEWTSYTHVIPLGYSERDDDWIKIDPDEVDIVKELFQIFTDPDSESHASYKATGETINAKYDGILDGHKVKTLLQSPVYIGKPQIPESWVIDLPYDNVVEDPDLKIIDEDTFEKAQRIIEEKDRKHSTDEETQDLVDFVEEFDLFSVLGSSEPVTLLHDCGEPMVKNGQRDLNGEVKTHLYYCPECDEHRKWPKNYEHDRMKIIHLLLDDEVSFLEALKEAFSMLKE